MFVNYLLYKLDQSCLQRTNIPRRYSRNRKKPELIKEESETK